MRRLNIWFALILIASALLLGAADPSPKPSPVPSPREGTETSGQTSGTSEGNPQSQQARTTPSASIINPKPTSYTANVHREIATQNEEKSKAVRVAPVNINRDWLDYIAPFLTFLLVVVGAAYTVVARCQLRAIGRQASIAEQELIIANRAYLYLSEVRINLFEPPICEPEAGSHIDITYPIYNGGQTPALFIGDHSRVTVADSASEISHDTDTHVFDRPQTAVVPPRGAEPLRPKHSSELSGPEFVGVQGRNKRIFFYGVLTYFDVFGREHHTWFALSYSGPPGQNMPMAFETKKGLNRFD